MVLAGARPGWGSDRDPCDRWKGVVCIIPGGTAGKGAPVVSELLLSGLGLKVPSLLSFCCREVMAAVWGVRRRVCTVDF